MSIALYTQLADANIDIQGGTAIYSALSHLSKFLWHFSVHRLLNTMLILQLLQCADRALQPVHKSVYLFSPSMAHILTKLNLLAEEHRHIGSRYDCWKSLFKTVLFDSTWDSLHWILSVFGVILHYRSPEFAVVNLICVAILSTFRIFTGWSSVDVRKSLLETPCTGTAMAWTAYLTHYSYIIPYLKNKLLELEEKYAVSVPLKCLILVFPTSCDVYGDFVQNGITHFKEIEYPLRDKVGTVNRKTISCLYKIEDEIEPLYCVLEKPSSLKVFKEMSAANKLSSYQQEQQMALYYQQLNSLLVNDKNCCNNYLFIKYNDNNDLNHMTLPNLIKRKVKEELVRLREQKVITIDS